MRARLSELEDEVLEIIWNNTDCDPTQTGAVSGGNEEVLMTNKNDLVEEMNEEISTGIQNNPAPQMTKEILPDNKEGNIIDKNQGE